MPKRCRSIALLSTLLVFGCSTGPKEETLSERIVGVWLSRVPADREYYYCFGFKADGTGRAESWSYAPNGRPSDHLLGTEDWTLSYQERSDTLVLTYRTLVRSEWLPNRLEPIVTSFEIPSDAPPTPYTVTFKADSADFRVATLSTMATLQFRRLGRDPSTSCGRPQ